METIELKKELRKLVSADKLEAATERLLTATASEAYGNYRKEVVHQSGRLEYWNKQQRLGTQDFADLGRTRSKVSLSLLDLIDDLPDEAELAETKPILGIPEDHLKRRLFWSLLGVKLMVIGFAYLLWSTSSGLSAEYFIATLSLLLPVFVTFLAFMVKEAAKDRYLLRYTEQRVSRHFAWLAYGLVVGYGIIILFILNLRGQGDITFVQMITALGLFESGLGAYLGKVIFGLFKKS